MADIQTATPVALSNRPRYSNIFRRPTQINRSLRSRKLAIASLVLTTLRRAAYPQGIALSLGAECWQAGIQEWPASARLLLLGQLSCTAGWAYGKSINGAQCKLFVMVLRTFHCMITKQMCCDVHKDKEVMFRNFELSLFFCRFRTINFTR